MNNITTKALAGIALVLGLQSCAEPFYATDPYKTPNARLSALVLPPHTNEVELFFTGEAPKDEYIKLAAIEAKGPEYSSYGSLVMHLRQSAQKFGADAILVQDREYRSNTSNFGSSFVSTDNYPELRGIAIKYRKNLSLAQIPKEQNIQFYNPDKNAFEPALQLKLTLGGEIEEKKEVMPLAMNHYTNFIQQYSMQHLLQEQSPNWRSKDENGRTTHRQLHNRSFTEKDILFHYNTANQLEEIKIMHYSPQTLAVLKTQSERIAISYDTSGRIAERTVYRNDAPYLREVYHYNQATGAVDAVDTFLVSQEKERPFLKSEFTYYSPEEIK